MKLKSSLSLFISLMMILTSQAQNKTVRLSIESFYSDAAISKSTEYNAENFRDVYPYDPNDFLDRGVDKFNAGFYEEALIDFNEAIDLAPECG